MDNEIEYVDILINQFAKEAEKLEEKCQWNELILHCYKWLQYSDNDLEALKFLALAYYGVGNNGEVEKYCNIALSVLPSNSAERIPFDRIKQKVTIDKNIPGISSTNTELTCATFLNPEIDLGQTWVNDTDIRRIEEQLSQKQKDFDFSSVNEVCTNCWREIIHSRRYEIPSKGRIEILTTEKIENLLNIQAVRFIQEGASAPEVFVRFEFTDLKIGVLRINSDGSTNGFHEKYLLVKSIVNALSLTYYRDLVVPIYIETSRKREINPNEERNHGGKKLKSKKFPRHYFPNNNVHEFREWHLAQHRARHDVVGHVRRISPGYYADWDKQEQAMRAGIELPIGYTWVIEHKRGGQEDTFLVLVGTDLPRRTRFLPPTRAESDLDRLLIPFQ